MDKIPTAEKFFNGDSFGMSETTEYQYAKRDIEQRAILFAKLHVEAALKEASKKANVYYDEDYDTHGNIDKDSILKAYPLNNIQ